MEKDEIKKANFRDWTLTKLDKTFGMKQIFPKESVLLQKWKEKAQKETISEFEQQTLLNLQEPLQRGGKAWNEFELENKFISPVIMTAKIDDKEIAYFLERPLEGKIGDYHLSGIVDGMIATGFREPDIPFFCMHEYKKSIENAGMPDAQALAAMMVAREMNDNKKPIYGMYIVGLIWNFMILESKEYCISKSYNAEDEEVFDIFKMLKALKQIIKTELV